MSRGANQELSPIDLNGIRYEQIVLEQSEPLDRRSGYLRAIDISSGKILWEKQAYQVTRNPPVDENGEPLIDIFMYDCFFKRFILLPNQHEILIENERNWLFILDTKTTEIRQVSFDELPECVKYKPKFPRWTPLLFHRGRVYCQELEDFFYQDIPNCGRIICYDVKEGKEIWEKRIYNVPPDLSVVGDLQQCYMRDIGWMPGKRDIEIINQFEQRFLLDIRTREVKLLSAESENYFTTRRSWKGRLKDFCLDIVDFFTRRG